MKSRGTRTVRSTRLKAAGCERIVEESVSGTRTDRQQLAAALAFAHEGDVLVVTRLAAIHAPASVHREHLKGTKD
jgi:DNA invertase Pin-like site-specific DNA recombinase